MQLPIELEKLQNHFTTWLSVLGYAWQTVQNKRYVLELYLRFVHQSGQGVTPQSAQAYIDYLQDRPHRWKTGALTLPSIRQYGQVLLLLGQYYQQFYSQNWQLELPPSHFDTPPRLPLTTAQIQKIYGTIDAQKSRLRHRDRAQLALWYGCGLRLNESRQVLIGDVQFSKNHLFVRKGKGGKTRVVPMTPSIQTDLRNYLQYHRLAHQTDQLPYLITSNRGNALDGSVGQNRCRTWRTLANIQQAVSPHIFRHSIATHLLEQGMEITQIQQFLGHRSLSATQIYTHVDSV